MFQRLFSLVVPLVLLFVFVERAACIEVPPALPGWEEFDQRRDGFRRGVTLDGAMVNRSSPVIADIDGDPSNGLEVVVGGADGIVHAYRADGSKLWSTSLPIRGCSRTDETNKLYSSPAVGRLFRGKAIFVVIGYGGFGADGKACGGGVAAIRGRTGKIRWNFNLKRFARRNKIPALSYSVFSTPALADVDGDGRMEIGFGTFSRYSFLLEAGGKLRWYYCNADTVWSSPAFADVDGDGQLEMIIGSDITRNDHLRPPTPNGGYVVALRTKKRSKKHIWFRDSSAVVWETYFDQTIMSSPVVADVLPGNPGAEILIGSGCYFPENSRNKNGKWVKILRLRDGKVLKTLPTQACLSSSVAVGDIDQDQRLEVVAIVNGSKSVGGTGQSELVAWKPNIPGPLWVTTPKVQGKNDPFAGDFKSPVIADLDGNGSLEVIISNGVGLAIFNGADGSALTCQDKVCDQRPSLSLFVGNSLEATPAVGDLNQDGILDLVIGSGSRIVSGKGGLYVWSGFAEKLGSYPGTLAPYSAPWPMFRGNPARHGRY
ncbi:MAG: hypothetical protein GX589_00120 [Deltaproteobacteria bacterium]|nr:hypothetical protein [Deltaproteobacteria bacterium]